MMRLQVQPDLDGDNDVDADDLVLRPGVSEEHGVLYGAASNRFHRIDLRTDGSVAGTYELRLDGPEGAFRVWPDATGTNTPLLSLFPGGTNTVELARLHRRALWLECLGPGAGTLRYRWRDPDGEPRFGDALAFTGVKVDFVALWEMTNPAKQIFNPTRKDDPVDNYHLPDDEGCTYGVPRSYLHMVPDPIDHAYKSMLAASIQPSSVRTRCRAAVTVAGQVLEESDTSFTEDGVCELVFLHPATSSGTEDFIVRVGLDLNGDNQLSCSEFISFFVVRPDTGERIGTPLVRGASEARYGAAADSIDDIVDGDWTTPGWLTNLVLPHAKRQLQIFRDGHALGVPIDKQPTSFTTQPFSALGGYFSEWLTHNSGAAFDSDGNCVLTEYGWDKLTSLANLVATSPQIRDTVATYYSQTVYQIVTNHFADLPVGSTAEFPEIPDDGYDVAHTSESPAWVPPYTVTFDDWQPNMLDDLNGTLGRGRLLTHKARYTVEKRGTLLGSELIVTMVRSWGEVIDLYDFNHGAGGAACDAAILQIGFGNGSQSEPRIRGRVFRNRIQFDRTYLGLP